MREDGATESACVPVHAEQAAGQSSVKVGLLWRDENVTGEGQIRALREKLTQAAVVRTQADA